MITPPWKGFLVEDLHVLVYQFDEAVKVIIFLEDTAMEVVLKFEEELNAKSTYEQVDEATIGLIIREVVGAPVSE